MKKSTVFKFFCLIAVVLLSLNLRAQTSSTVIKLNTPITGDAILYLKLSFNDLDGKFNTGIALSQDTVKAWGDYSAFLRTNNVSNNTSNTNIWDVRDGAAFKASATAPSFNTALTYDCWMVVSYASSKFTAYIKADTDTAPVLVYENAAWRKTPVTALNYICTPFHATESPLSQINVLSHAIVAAVGDVPDLVAPTAVITTASNSPIKPFDITITFTEAVVGFDSTDVTVTNGKVSRLITTDNKVFTTTVSPNAAGKVSVSLAAGVATDAALNPNLASAALEIIYPFNSTIAKLDSPITGKAVLYVKMGFDNVDGKYNTGLALSQDTVKAWADYSAFLRVNNTSNTPAAGNNLFDVRNGGAFALPLVPVPFDATKKYDVWFDVDVVAGTSSMYVKSDADAAPVLVFANAGFRKKPVTAINYISTPFHATESPLSRVDVLGYAIVGAVGEYDTTAPTAVITTTTNSPVKPFDVTITFSEKVTGFESTDITVTNGKISSLVSTDNKVFTATVSPNAAGKVSVSLAAGVATDLSLNPNTASAALDVIYPFSSTIVKLDTPITDKAVLYVKMSFDNVDGKYNTGLALSQDTVKAWADYSAFLRVNNTSNTPAAGNNLFDVRNGGAFALPLVPVPFDVTKEYDVWFDVDVAAGTSSMYVKSDADAAPVLVFANAGFRKKPVTAINYISTPFHATESPLSRVEVLANAIVSAVGDIPGDTTVVVNHGFPDNMENPDNWNITNLHSNLDLTAVWNYSENIPTAGAGGCLRLTAVADNSEYQYCIWKEVTLEAGVIYEFDAAFKDLVGSTQFWSEVYIGKIEPNDSTDYNKTNGDAVEIARFNAWNACKAGLGFDGTYQNGGCSDANYIYIPQETGTYYFVIKTGVGSWVAGQLHNLDVLIDEVSLVAVPDTFAPTTTITTATKNVESAFDITVTFNEPVVGFELADITVTNGTASNLVTTDNKVFTATVTPIAAGTVSVSIAAGVATDAALNANEAATAIDVTYKNVSVDSKRMNTLKVYPNPASKTIHISTVDNNDFAAEIFNISGRRVYSNNKLNSNNAIDISSLAKGLYTVKVKTTEGTMVQKLVVE